MRYLVRARLKPGREAALLQTIEKETLGQGSVAPPLCRKNALTGKNTLTSRTCRTPTTAANAATQTVPSRGPAATAIAPRGWSRS
jgi:hypothetical protein